MNISPIEDQVLIRSLLEIVDWLASVDSRRLHSLKVTSGAFRYRLKCTSGNSNTMYEVSIPLRLSASLHSKDRVAYVGLGWRNICSKLSAMTPEQESKFLDVMLTEHNLELALQLDTDPSTDRLLNTPEVVRRPLIIVGGGSHASRLANALGSINPEVVDLSIGGWKVTEDNVRDLATDVGDALEAAESPEGCTIVLQLLDNSLFKGGSKTSQIYPVKLGGTFHIVGELSTINEDKFKEIFKMVIPIFRAARGSSLLDPWRDM